MTNTQAWALIIEVGIIALAYLVGLFPRPGRLMYESLSRAVLVIILIVVLIVFLLRRGR